MSEGWYFATTVRDRWGHGIANARATVHGVDGEWWSSPKAGLTIPLPDGTSCEVRLDDGGGSAHRIHRSELLTFAPFVQIVMPGWFKDSPNADAFHECRLPANWWERLLRSLGMSDFCEVDA